MVSLPPPTYNRLRLQVKGRFVILMTGFKKLIMIVE